MLQSPCSWYMIVGQGAKYCSCHHHKQSYRYNWWLTLTLPNWILIWDMLEEVGYIRLYCTSLQLVPTLSRCKTLFFATVIPFHKLWVMHRRWSYFQMYLSLYWSRQDWLCAWVPKVIWNTIFTQCESSLSVALWYVVGKPFFPCTYYWLLLAFLGWADGPYLKACSQMVLHTSLYSICLTSIGCGLSLSHSGCFNIRSYLECFLTFPSI